MAQPFLRCLGALSPIQQNSTISYVSGSSYGANGRLSKNGLLQKAKTGLKATMSYEGKMYEQFAMPTRKQVEQDLLRALLKHGGVIKEFGLGQEIVDEIANDFGLSEQ